MNEAPNPEVAVFAAALELPADQRGAYLDQACAGDAALRRQVEALLRVHDDAGNFFDKLGSVARPTSPERAMAGSGGTIQLSGIPAEKMGDRIGRYKLLQQIGEGGCGIVYMAEQEEPVRRRVALKVIKLGMDTKNVIARFEAERQALALMDHSNIAKVIDAGATETGRPYFVMELVRGIKITDYCDENNLSTVARLELFVLVCQAIQHAHQKGIIHRDIKPSNILVADHDGVPVPKIIDFGIAKATTDQRLTDKTLFTAFEQFIGTPAYMSPEQARLSGLDIDTRSDIYSLGVLLYELLTAKTPFEARQLHEWGLDEIRRIIREEEPLRPSTRLQTLGMEEQTTVAKHRQSDAPKLVHLVRGDLDWIVMKALEKDRARRYETANGLAADVQRHLSNEPVVARPPSNLYRLQKLVRRNKLAFVATSVVVVALVTGLGLATFGLLQARTERDAAALAERRAEQDRAAAEKSRQQAEADKQKAQTEAAKSQQISKFLEEMFKGVSPWVASGRDTVVLRGILDKAAGRLGGDLTNQPEVELELRNTIGQVYLELGDAKSARAVLQDAPSIARKLWGNDDLRLASSFQKLALANANPKGGELLQREALKIRRKVLGNESQEVGVSLRDVANMLRMEGRQAEAEKTEREALTIQWKLWPQGDPEIAASLFDLSLVLREAGRWPEAESANRQSLAMYIKMSGVENPDVNPDVARVSASLGYLLLHQGELAEAESMLWKALAMQTKLFGNDYPDAARTLNSIAGMLKDQNKLAEAEQAERKALAIQRKSYASNDKNVVNTLDQLVDILKRQGKLAEAESLAHEAQATSRMPPGAGYHAPAEADSFVNLAEAYVALGQQAEAEQAYRDALGAFIKSGAVGSSDYGPTAQSLLDLLVAENKLVEAEKLYEVIAARRSALGNESVLVAKTLFVFAEFLKSQNRPEEAAQKYRESADIYLLPPWEEHLFKLPPELVFGLLEVGEKQRAVSICRALLDSTSRNALWFNNVSWYLATTENPSNRDPALAVELANRSMKINSQGDWNTVGVAFYRAGDFKQALDYLRRSGQRANGDDSSFDTFFLAMAEHQVGNVDGARRYYTQATKWMDKHDPQNSELLRFRAETERLLGSEVKAGAENPSPVPPGAK